jgi:hypothetical protein
MSYAAITPDGLVVSRTVPCPALVPAPGDHRSVAMAPLRARTKPRFTLPASNVYLSCRRAECARAREPYLSESIYPPIYNLFSFAYEGGLMRQGQCFRGVSRFKSAKG